MDRLEETGCAEYFQEVERRIATAKKKLSELEISDPRNRHSAPKHQFAFAVTNARACAICGLTGSAFSESAMAAA